MYTSKEVKEIIETLNLDEKQFLESLGIGLVNTNNDEYCYSVNDVHRSIAECRKDYLFCERVKNKQDDV